MGDLEGKELCNLACNPSLDGYTPNPLYHAGYCPDYMQQECNEDGSMFKEQWENHQNNIKDYNARRVMSMSFHQSPQEYQYVNPGQVQGSVQQPPSMSEVFQAMYSKVPVHPAVNTLPSKKSKAKTSKKSTKAKTSKKSTKKSTTRSSKK